MTGETSLHAAARAVLDSAVETFNGAIEVSDSSLSALEASMSTSEQADQSRAERLSQLLDYAYHELFWISEYPNRGGDEDHAVQLAERARNACSQVETGDPDNHL